MEREKTENTTKGETGMLLTSSPERIALPITDHKLNGQNFTNGRGQFASSSKEKERKGISWVTSNNQKRGIPTFKNGNWKIVW